MANYYFERECRTASSECYTIVDDGNAIGRLDLHFTPTVVHATLAVSESLTQEQIQETMMALQKDMMAKQQAHVQKLAEDKKKEGEAFLAENGKKEGVTTLPSGLQYKVIQSGAGKTPRPSDTVTAHYRGALTDGTEFDNSYRRGKPEEFPVNGVIPGWQEALQKMKVGDKWQLFIPAHLAYGPSGSGPIPPNATLVFDIELIAVK